MKKFFAILFLASLIHGVCHAQQTQDVEIYKISSGLAIKNISTHTYIASWDRYFFVSDRGTIEFLTERSDNSRYCLSLIIKVDNSPRYFGRSDSRYIINFPANAPAAICDDFVRNFKNVMDQVTLNKPATLNINFDAGVEQFFELAFNGQKFCYPREKCAAFRRY